jgi:Flp pilus assembly pilin Flp
MRKQDDVPVVSTDCGATAIEYSFMASLIAVVILASVALLGQNVMALFNLMPAGL